MLCTTQPKRKRKCMFQDALKCTRGRREWKTHGFPSLFLGQKLQISVSTFGVSRLRAASWLTRVKKSPVKGQTDARQPAGRDSSSGSAGPCLPGTFPSSPQPIGDLLGAGKWSGSGVSGHIGREEHCGEAGELLSTLPPPAPLRSAAQRCSLPRSGSQGGSEPVWGGFSACLLGWFC